MLIRSVMQIYGTLRTSNRAHAEVRKISSGVEFLWSQSGVNSGLDQYISSIHSTVTSYMRLKCREVLAENRLGQSIEVFFDFPCAGPVSNFTLEVLILPLLLDAFLKTAEAPTEHGVASEVKCKIAKLHNSSNQERR